MVLRCTKKLLDTYKIKPAGEVASNDFYSWHADLFYIERKKCLIFINDATRFCITLYDISKAEFEKEAIGLWAESLVRLGAKFSISELKIEQYIKRCLSEPQGIPFTKTNSRSVIAHMNQQKNRAAYIVYDYFKEGILHTVELNKTLNDIPMMCGTKDCYWPYECFAKRLKAQFGGQEHHMKLESQPFEKIAAGKKIYEIRLFDEKRRHLRISDEIVFTNTDDGRQIRREVRLLQHYTDFKQLCKDFHYHFTAFGCEDGCTEDEFIRMMRKYYSEDEERKYGVLAIRLDDVNIF